MCVVEQNLMKDEPLKLVEGGQSQQTFIYVKDTIDVVQRMIVSSSVCKTLVDVTWFCRH
jgi:dTDP-D-glucose 4,6-dehydratase